MKSLADGLPLDVAKQIHPDWYKNEAAYWAVRNQLLGQYEGQWVGFADGVVIVSGSKLQDVYETVLKSPLHPFMTRVGHESEPWFRIRRASFAYDTSYQGSPLPVITTEFRRLPGASGTVFDRVIPDTGSDTTTLPWSDCQLLQLNLTLGVPGMIIGVAGTSKMTVGFLIYVWLDGHEYPCRLQADFSGNERILGRDVLNQLEVLFRGPSGEVVVNP